MSVFDSLIIKKKENLEEFYKSRCFDFHDPDYDINSILENDNNYNPDEKMINSLTNFIEKKSESKENDLIVSIDQHYNQDEKMINSIRNFIKEKTESGEGDLRASINGHYNEHIINIFNNFLSNNEENIYMCYGSTCYRAFYICRIDGKNIIVHKSSYFENWFNLNKNEINNYTYNVDLDKYPHVRDYLNNNDLK